MTDDALVTGPWWGGRGEEPCEHCGEYYPVGAEARCARCDAAVCPFCVQYGGKNLVCPGCAPQRH